MCNGFRKYNIYNIMYDKSLVIKFLIPHYAGILQSKVKHSIKAVSFAFGTLIEQSDTI